MNKVLRPLSFALLCGFSVILWFRPLLDTFRLARGDERYTHILLILPVTVALIFQVWQEREFKSQRWTPAIGLLVISLVIAGCARWANLSGRYELGLALAIVALVVWWVGSFVLCFGLATLRLFRFPLFFLLWMVPIPSIVLDRIVTVLQKGSTLSAQGLFSMFMVPVVREGTILHIPGLGLEVAPECSSIRSSLMLLVTTMVLAHVFLRTPWRKALVVLIALPLSVAKNGLRIFSIGMLTTRVDPSFLTGRLHRNGGIIFFLIALGVIFVALWWLRRSESAATTAPPQLRPARS